MSAFTANAEAAQETAESDIEGQLNQTLVDCNDCLNRSDFSGALKLLDHAVDLSPGNPEILSHRGRLLLFLKEFDRARADFAEAAQVDARSASTLSGLARCHFEKGGHAEAGICARRALDLDPANREAGEILSASGKFVGAKSVEARKDIQQFFARAHDESNLPTAKFENLTQTEPSPATIDLDSGLTLEIGTHSYIHDHKIRNPSGALTGITIGKFCSIATGLTVIGYDHHSEWVAMYPFLDDWHRANWPGTNGIPYPQSEEFGSNKSRGAINIGNDVWIGTEVKLFKGVNIGNGAVIGACSLVNKSVEPYTIVAGIPARPIRKRFSDTEIALLLKIQWWDLPVSLINRHMALLCSSNIAGLEKALALDPEFQNYQSGVPSTHSDRNGHSPSLVPPIEPQKSRAVPMAAADVAGKARKAVDQFLTDARQRFAEVEPPPLSELHLKNSRVVPSREKILELMPKGGICAEIGTQTGNFARQILTIIKPAKFHIFDIDFTPFDHAPFQTAIQQGIVELHQGDSSSLLAALPDRSFDFIYIDGDHSYDGIVKDLDQAARKIKDDGWIVCNDYTLYSPLEQINYGVYRAVNEFCFKHGFEIVYLGLHPWSYHDVALRKMRPPERNGHSPKESPAKFTVMQPPETAPASIDPAPLTENRLRQLAKFVGDDWKQRPYYDEAEQYMEQQWREAIWPFIQSADFSYVLDLAAGHGRNSEKLKQHAKKIHIVDINSENIEFCKKRFAGDSRFLFNQNDGCSLNFIPSASISLVYCFDAMVHFDSDVVRAYLREFARVLRPNGLGFCHHSNYTQNPGGDVHRNPGWRNFMSQALFAHYCSKEGLAVVKSRVIDWELPGSDCITLFRKKP